MITNEEREQIKKELLQSLIMDGTIEARITRVAVNPVSPARNKWLGKPSSHHGGPLFQCFKIHDAWAVWEEVRKITRMTFQVNRLDATPYDNRELINEFCDRMLGLIYEYAMKARKDDEVL